MAAESYCRLSGSLAALNVTTGPGGINALNGVYGAFTDSIAMIVISGQVKRETIAANYSKQLRQLGDQEVNILAMVKPITKYATSVSDPLAVRSTLLKAIFYARNGRPGPVWIDIPIDVQGSLVEENELERYLEPDFTAAQRDPDVAPNTLGDFKALCGDSLATVATEIVARLQKAKRPVVFAGAGIRIAGCYSQFLALIEDMQVPVVCGFNAHDLLPNDHALYAGRPGTIGDRPGNFSVQNADFLLILGCRLNIRQISYNWQSFAPKAWKVHVDIDPSELEKHTLKTDMKVHADLRHFLPAMSKQLQSRGAAPQVHAEYLAWCRERVSRYPVVQQHQRVVQLSDNAKRLLAQVDHMSTTSTSAPLRIQRFK
jgi:acetolactate synthase-1/2/3 large subunit